MVFPGSWTFSWFLRWSLRRNALWQTSQRKVFVWLWIRMCRFNLNFDVNFLSQSGRKSLSKTYSMQFVKLAHYLESCTRMEFLLCESTHAACDGNVRFDQPHVCSHCEIIMIFKIIRTNRMNIQLRRLLRNVIAFWCSVQKKPCDTAVL